MDDESHGKAAKDRLSQLPEDILHRIMNLVERDWNNSLRSVACFSILSKACRQAFLSYHHLFFIRGQLEKETHFVDRVDRSLQQATARGTPIDGFTIEAQLSELKQDTISRWMNCIRALNVRVINLQFQFCCVKVPLLLFSDMTCLEEIYFECCELLMPCFNADSCKALRKLSLNDGYKHVNNNVLHDILSELTQLEFLSLSSLREPDKGLQISSPSITNLEIIRHNSSQELEIKCPNLCHLYCSDYVVPSINLGSSCPLNCKVDLCFSPRHLDSKRKDTFFTQLKCLLWNFNNRASSVEVWLSSLWAMHDHGFNRKKISNPEESNGWCHPAALTVLKLNLFNTYCPFPSEVLDDFLLLCRPKFVTITYCHQYGYFNKALQSIRNMATDKRIMFNCGCKDGQELKYCWHHSLKEVKLERSGVVQKYEEIDMKFVDLDFLSQQTKPPGGVSLRVYFRLIWK